MARTILDDYFQDTDSHFELAYKIPHRAREIQRTGNALVEPNGDKPIVVALREISERPSRYEGDGADAADGMGMDAEAEGMSEAAEAAAAAAKAEAAEEAKSAAAAAAEGEGQPQGDE